MLPRSVTRQVDGEDLASGGDQVVAEATPVPGRGGGATPAVQQEHPRPLRVAHLVVPRAGTLGGQGSASTRRRTGTEWPARSTRTTGLLRRPIPLISTLHGPSQAWKSSSRRAYLPRAAVPMCTRSPGSRVTYRLS